MECVVDITEKFLDTFIHNDLFTFTDPDTDSDPDSNPIPLVAS